MEREGEALIAAISSVEGDSPEALMHRSVDAFFSYVEAHPFAWRMLFRDPPADAAIAAVHASVMSRARIAISEGAEEPGRLTTEYRSRTVRLREIRLNPHA